MEETFAGAIGIERIEECRNNRKSIKRNRKKYSLSIRFIEICDTLD